MNTTIEGCGPAGTGGFTGATGRLDIKDDVATGQYLYRGHTTLG